MKFMMTMFLFIPSIGFCLSDADLAIIKQAEGSYEFADDNQTKSERRLCSEGPLEYDSESGHLMLGATAIAVDLLTDEKLKARPKDQPADGCSEQITNKMNKDVLVFKMTSGCSSNQTLSEINRHIKFEKTKLVYVQKNKFQGKQTAVTCTLKKVSENKSKADWKVIPAVKEVPEESQKKPAK